VGSANVLHGEVVSGHVHLGAMRVPGADHLEEGSAATAYVRPHDIRIGSADAPDGAVYATIVRISSLGWLARLTLQLPDDHTLIAHVPQEEMNGATEGDTVSVDLRNPKAFQRDDQPATRPEVPASA
jgi:sulfate transport system ATP-binding protein